MKWRIYNLCDRIPNPLISVIVPMYNVEVYAEKCIESIINQTYKNLEIILVDDGSTDSSGRICDIYATKDFRIKVVHKENGGLVSARKKGIQLSKGDYAAYVDGDDWIEYNMYERLLDQIGDADIIESGKIRDYGSHIIYEKNNIPDGIYEGEELERKVYSRMIYTGKFYERGIHPQIFQGLFSRELLLKSQMQVVDDISVGEDAACMYPMMLDARKVVLTSECYYHYRIREGSLMDIHNTEELWRLKIMYKYLQKCFWKTGNMKEVLLEQLDFLMMYILLLKEFKVFQNEDGIFPYSGIKKGDRIVVYGAGRFGKELVRYLKNEKSYVFVAWVDSKGIANGKESLENIEYDYILVAVLIHKMAEEISAELLDMGISGCKIKRIDIEEIEAVRKRLKIILYGEEVIV